MIFTTYRFVSAAAFVITLGLLSLLGNWEPLAQGQPECTVTVQPGQSIQAVIERAQAGAVICLQAGEWQENLVIEKGLTLRAAEVKPEPNVVIKSAKLDWPVILIRSEEPIEVAIIGLKITGAFGGCYKWEPEWICAYGISVHGKAKAVVQNNTISGNEADGILMLGSSQATIQNNSISNNGDGIVMWGSSQATIENNTISGNEADGILMLDSSQATIQNNTISDNGWNGIVMWGSSQATIQNNTISDNWDGILMGGSSQATIQNNTISDNRQDGIVMLGSSQATIETNTIQNNSRCGIFSSSDKPAQGKEWNSMAGNGVDLCGNLSARLRKPLVEETTQKELTFPGPYDSLQKTIDALAPGGTILVASGEHRGGLTIWKPLTLKGVGREQTTIKGAISLIDEAQGVMIEGMKITGSQMWGIILGGRAKATIQDNTISDNGDDGIWMWDSPQATIESNKIVNNGWYGVACYQRPCFDYAPEKFEGAVRGSKNEISGNKKADVCPSDLEFLKTSAGGCYGPKCK